MARLVRLVIPGEVHLVSQSAQGDRAVFGSLAARSAYLAGLREASRAAGVAIHAYGFLDHELRLLATPASPEALARMMQAVGRRAVRAINRERGATGSPWSGRFRSAVVESPACFLEVLRFVERPGLPADGGGPPELDRSSAAHHLGTARSDLVAVHPGFFQLGNTPFEREAAYRRWTETPPEANASDARFAAALNGWVIGSAGFRERLRQRVSRPVEPRTPGRPRVR